MKNIKTKILCFGAVVILMSSSISMITNAEYHNNQELEEYIVKIKVGDINNSEEDKIITKLTENELNEFKNRFNSIKNQEELKFDETVDELLTLLMEYEILSSEFTVENFQSLLLKNGKKVTNPPFQYSAQYYPLLPRFGPTGFLYASFFSQYTYIWDPFSNSPYIYFDINRLNDLLDKIFNIDNPIFQYLENISVGQYVRWAPWQIGIGGSIGFFASFSPIESLNYCFFGPFLGVFLSTIFLGLYIYIECENSDYPGGKFEGPIFDFIIGFPLFFSLVIPGWYPSPSQS